MKTQYVFSSIESAFGRAYQLDRNPFFTREDVVVPLVEKHFSFYEPLGISDPTTVFKPAWQIDFQEGEVVKAINPGLTVNESTVFAIGCLRDSFQSFGKDPISKILESIKDIINKTNIDGII